MRPSFDRASRDDSTGSGNVRLYVVGLLRTTWELLLFTKQYELTGFDWFQIQVACS